MRLQSTKTARSLMAALLPLVVFLCGCAGPSATESADADSQPDASDFERLRALGYVEVGDPLPADARTGVLIHDRDRARPGLNMFTNAHFCSTQLMDMNGEILHSWSHQPCHRWENTVLSPEGDLLIVSRAPHDKNPESARRSRSVMRMSWDGRVLWQKQLPAHHDVDVTPDGHVLTLGYELVLMEQVDPVTPVRDNSLVLLTAQGEIVEEISLWELLNSDSELFRIQPVPYREFEGGRDVDFFHTNVVEWMRHPELIENHPLYDENSVLICIRNQNTIAIIDWATKKLVWAWGQGELLTPHDATVLANGNILVFDNRLGRQWSRVVEVDPLTREIVWEYGEREPPTFYSGTRGANQRLSNGHTLITDSDSGRVFEIDPQGRVVWDFLNPNLTEQREPSVIVRTRRFEGLQFSDLAASIGSGRGLSVVVD
jgi:hypothetical protein